MAQTQTGKWSLKRLSRLIVLDARGELTVPQLLLLGVAVAVIHRFFDFGLGMPGHHGLELFTALLFARLTSTRPLAAAVVVGGMIGGDLALTTQFLHSLKNAPLYFLAGLLVDGFYHLAGAHRRFLAVAAVIGALAFVTKPLILLAVTGMTDLVFGFMRHGPVFPLITHGAFGAVGAVVGALLARAWNHKASDEKTD